MEKASIIANACSRIAADDLVGAEDLLRSKYPFDPMAILGGGISRAQSMRVFSRDGFVDRYSGQRLVFPGTLRVISMLLPSVFPYHANWKMDQCHFSYYELFPVVDHLLPRARGGTNDATNLVTTSTVRNSAKANFTLEELAWKLLSDHELDKWDGLTSWFFAFVQRRPELLEKPESGGIAGWADAARQTATK